MDMRQNKLQDLDERSCGVFWKGPQCDQIRRNHGINSVCMHAHKQILLTMKNVVLWMYPN